MTNSFSFCAPCLYVQGTETFRCSLSLSVSRDFFWIQLVNDLDVTNVVCFPLNKYEQIQIYGSAVVLISPHLPTISFVFFSQQNQERFIFSLGEAAAIAPLVRGYYKIMETNLFIPKAQYTFISKNFEDYFFYIASQNICTITPDTVPEKVEFFDLITPHYHKRAFKRFLEYMETHPKANVADRPVTFHNLMNWIRKVLRGMNWPVIGRFKTLLQRYHEQTYSSEYDDALMLIDQDAIKNRCDDPEWDDELKALTTNILRADVMHGSRYNQGEYEVAQKVVLLMYESSGLRDDQDPSLPKWFDEMSDDDLRDFALATYQKVSRLFKKFDKDMNKALDEVADGVFNMFKDVIPELRIWFIVHRIDQLIHLGDDFQMLFANSFKEIWKAWQWIFSCQKPEDAYVAFIASILFFSVPVYIEEHVDSPEKLLSDKFHRITNRMDINVVLNFANYLMKKSKWKRARSE